MKYTTLKWHGPHLIATLDLKLVPKRPGVYVFTEYEGPLVPNNPIPPESSPDYEQVIEKFRNTPCVLYVGMSVRNLRHRVRSYLFKPYLEIKRRPKGTPPRHVAPKHKGAALLHAQQFFDGKVYVRWAGTSSPKQIEKILIRELRPALNTVGWKRRI